jgi:hypothetical protein
MGLAMAAARVHADRLHMGVRDQDPIHGAEAGEVLLENVSGLETKLADFPDEQDAVDIDGLQVPKMGAESRLLLRWSLGNCLVRPRSRATSALPLRGGLRRASSERPRGSRDVGPWLSL